jgi:hypothetical protein
VSFVSWIGIPRVGGFSPNWVNNYSYRLLLYLFTSVHLLLSLPTNCLTSCLRHLATYTVVPDILPENKISKLNQAINFWWEVHVRTYLIKLNFFSNFLPINNFFILLHYNTHQDSIFCLHRNAFFLFFQIWWKKKRERNTYYRTIKQLENEKEMKLCKRNSGTLNN